MRTEWSVAYEPVLLDGEGSDGEVNAVTLMRHVRQRFDVGSAGGSVLEFRAGIDVYDASCVVSDAHNGEVESHDLPPLRISVESDGSTMPPVSLSSGMQMLPHGCLGIEVERPMAWLERMAEKIGVV